MNLDVQGRPLHLLTYPIEQTNEFKNPKTYEKIIKVDIENGVTHNVAL